jgi:argininosuccinate lyase
MTKKVWGGRFREDINETVDAFNSSIAFDRRLYTQDIEGSKAHCRMLAKQGIISDEEASNIIDALAEIKREIERGSSPFMMTARIYIPLLKMHLLIR